MPIAQRKTLPEAPIERTSSHSAVLKSLARAAASTSKLGQHLQNERNGKSDGVVAKSVNEINKKQKRK
jgi:hypothetical protein